MKNKTAMHTHMPPKIDVDIKYTIDFFSEYEIKAIVHAVNAHGELLDASKQLVYELEARFARTGCNVNEEIAMRKMRNAIAKAEGK